MTLAAGPVPDGAVAAATPSYQFAPHDSGQLSGVTVLAIGRARSGR